MSTQLISFPRRFQMWAYTVGHGELLLRSPKAPGLPTRIDVLFKNVSGIHLPTLSDGLQISEATEKEETKLRSQLSSSRLEGRKVFVVRVEGFMGYVIAGVVAWHEDKGEYYEPSFFQLASNEKLQT